MSLKHKTFSALRWTAAASGVRALLHLAQVAVLARLLVPEDYGLMAMVGVVLVFAGLFSDMGMSSAFIQRQDVSLQERSSLFWLNICLSAVLMLVVIVLSPLLSHWFGDVRLSPLLMLAASTFVINAIGQQMRMNAEKALNFRPVVLLELGSAVFGFATAVVGALAGWGVYALIAGGLVSSIAGSVFAWFYLTEGWRPMWRFRLNDVRSYFGFGGAMVANNLVNEVNRSVDLFLGGKLLGAAALGFYSMPRNIVFHVQNLVNPIITRIGFPLIAQVQHDIPRVRSIYLQTINMTASTNAPIYIGIAFFAPEVVAVLLGSKWLDSAELLRVLVVWGFLRSTGNPVGSLLMGMGRAKLQLKWNLGLLCLIPPVMWWGSTLGHMGLAWTLLGVQVMLFIPGWYFLVRPVCHAGLSEYSMAAFRPLILSLVSIAPGYYITRGIEYPLFHLLAGMLIAVPLYIFLSYIFNRCWCNSLLNLIKKTGY